MALKIGIVGLPNVGKSTLFNALTRTKGAESANYPFCTIEPNVGIVEVPDERLCKLEELIKPEKVIPAAIEFVDIAGLVKGASKGEGLGNQFLAAIREVDAICHVVRAFEDSDVIHVEGEIHPKRDREIIETELILADLQTLHSHIEKIRNAARTGDKEKQKELDVLEKLEAALQENKMACTVELEKEEKALLPHVHLLTDKPIIYAINIAEEQMHTLPIKEARELLGLGEHTQAILISAKIEQDLQDLSDEEAKEFLSELGVTSSGLDRLIKAAYKALGYFTYFTAGPQEVRAWNIVEGTNAPDAAAVIHTDFKKGFIRAETIAYDDYIAAGSEQGAKEAGKVRQEGKEYVVKDGDIMHFKFNV